MVKILNSKSEAADHERKVAPETFSLISNEKLLAIYTAMVKCRMLSQRATVLFQQGKLASDLRASAWREASAAAVGVDLQPDDAICIAPDDWLPAFVKGMSLEGIFRLIAPAASETQAPSCAEAEQKNILVPLNNASLGKAVCDRAADALTQKRGAIVVAIIASGPESLKQWHKPMANAAASRLPIIFVHTVEQQTEPAGTIAKSRTRKPEATFHGVPAIAVDALDLVAVYRVAYEAILRARQARGATLLECTVLRKLPQALQAMKERESGDDTTFADPVTAMEIYLKRKAIDPGPYNKHIVDSFTRDLDLATRFLDRGSK